MNVLRVSKKSVTDTDLQTILNPLEIDTGITAVSCLAKWYLGH